MNVAVSSKKSPLIFFLLVFALSIPFLLFSAIAGQLANGLPINLPVSALMFVCPIAAAMILVYRQDGPGGIKGLVNRIFFDHKKIRQELWYVPIIFLMPVIMLLSYVAMRLMGVPLPEPAIPFLAIPIFFIVFFIGAVGEETGWMGYAFDPLQDRWGALIAGIIVGSVWAIWHIVPYLQAHNTPTWIAGQCFFTIMARIIIVWLYNNTGKSILAAILFHTMINVSVFLFPNFGSDYDPIITGAIIGVIAVIVTFLWGTKTLARYRYARRPEGR